MSALQAEQIRRVIVRGANWVGDTMMTFPALRELRRLLPDAHITLVTRPGTAGLLAEADFIDQILLSEDNGWRSLGPEIAKWRSGHFDLAILFPNSFQTALVAALARVPMRLGYAAEARGFLLTQAVAQPEWRSSRHEVFYYLNLISRLETLINGTSPAISREPDYSLQVSPARTATAIESLRHLGVTAERPLVALCPGSINSRAKRWPPDRYAAVGDRLIEELGAEVVLIGSPDEREVSIAVALQMRNQPIIATGSGDLQETTAILSLVELLITNDTGPAHIASALGRPTLVIFGPTNPLTTRPFGASGEIIRQPPVCAPCMLRECPIDHRCMTAISPDEVFARATAMLERSGKLQGVGV